MSSLNQITRRLDRLQVFVGHGFQRGSGEWGMGSGIFLHSPFPIPHSLSLLAFLTVAQGARLFAFDSRSRAVAVLWDDAFDFNVRAWDDMNRDQFADSPSGGGAGVCGRFDRADIAANEDSHVSRADVFFADQLNIGGFDHRVSGFDRADKAFRLDHAESFHTH